MPDVKIMVCHGTSGLSAGASEVYKKFEEELGRQGLLDSCELIKTGDRGYFRDVLVDIIHPNTGRITYQNVKPEIVPELVEKHVKNGEIVKKHSAGKAYQDFFAGQKRIVLRRCGEIDPENIESYLEDDGYKALEKALTQMKPEEVIEEIKKSGLRGRGGAGFPTGIKWELCRTQETQPKYVICNADEGDPGAFMDRSVLEGDPHAVLEGMAIAGYAIGSNEGYIYCRAEYPLAIKRLKIAISQAKERGFIGEDIFGAGFSFDIKLVEGAGAFVCGEETALIASIEGKRGMPKPRPPYPAQKGLWGKPTIINNVETLANVPTIILRGGDWYASIGTEKSKGTKVFALAGKVKNTGLVEVPLGTTIRELLYGPGGGPAKKMRKIKAIQIGGPSGGCIPEKLFDTPIDFDSLVEAGAIMGSGGLIVLDDSTCMVDLARFFLSFTSDESCGKCFPCRLGLKKMLEILNKIVSGNGELKDIERLENLAKSIMDTALCGLGKTAPNPVLTTLKYFREEYEAHILEKRCPANQCVALLKFEVNEERCTKCGRCAKVCPENAIIWEKGEYAKIVKEKCIKCKACIEACDFMAIE
ncbi:NADH-quinone oxidoreductase subunit NuoF [Archaeoglobales archaeon]|nr:MAG: NADH-quinone oxidoreductase subunit NuoF [Archaeoglobales archaeon]